MKKLYELTDEMLALMESEEEITETALTVVFGDIQVKAANVCQFIKVLEGDAAVFKAEEDRLHAHRVALENKAKATKDYLKINMEKLGIDSISAGIFKPSLQVNSQSKLIMEEGAEIPADCKIIIPQQEIADEAKIKERLKNGEEIKGFRLERGKYLRIR